MRGHGGGRRDPADRSRGGRISGAPVRPRAGAGSRAAAVLVGLLWWWAVLRLTLWPASAGPVEGAVTAGGWGLSLLPVHCVPWTGRRSRAGPRAPGAGPPERSGGGTWDGAVRAVLTRAWRRHRSGGGSGRS
ncbi:hypothetical protein ACIBK8_34325 [Streptomyces sp. NPDC050161]|uniref:hypothetical protein n=1 Tax=Streptomyces sp. NPDC050161 TaxID=3365604 RepID=UPI00379CE7B7